MSDPQVTHGGKLSALNKKIIEVKKKIQLSEGQRKANFEECDARKRESAEKISRLKREVKELQLEFAKAKNNEEAIEQAARISSESSTYLRNRSFQEAVAKLDEDNIRLRKKLDLIKYQSDKQKKKMTALLQEYEALMSGKPGLIGPEKPANRLIKQKIVKLENQLHRVSVMQMEADTVRKKYKSVWSSLKNDAAYYASCLDELEAGIREQEAEIKRLQEVKTEAINLRDTTREALNFHEIQEMKMSKERDFILQEYRKRVEDRKLELERLERMMFASTRGMGPRDDSDAGRKTPMEGDPKDIPLSEIEQLEEVFVKLRDVTGVSRTEEVLDRFLAQRATKEKLDKMKTKTEEEKMAKEKERQQLTMEIEMQKFAETKDADQNKEKLEKLNKQIDEQRLRQNRAEEKLDDFKNLFQIIGLKLLTLSEKLDEENNSELILPEDNIINVTIDPAEILNQMTEKFNVFIENVGGIDKYNELVEQILIDRMESMSLETSSEHTKQPVPDEQPLFPLFPTVTTPAAPAQPSDDEEDIPTRSFLKRQAQLLVDAKSRRKGFAYRR